MDGHSPAKILDFGNVIKDVVKIFIRNKKEKISHLLACSIPIVITRIVTLYSESKS